MSSSLAFIIWLVLLVALLRFDAVRLQRGSIALWLPVAWFFLIGSRLPSQWFGGISFTPGNLAEGNLLDRNIWLSMILLSFMVLKSRNFRWQKFFQQNVALSALVVFSLLSVFWSDFPFVAFKRWFRDLGTYLVILVALSDANGVEAVRWVFRRVFFLLVPLSILLMKYFPEMAREYDPWTGQGYFMGAAQSKNMLGVMCLINGMYFFWDTLAQWRDRKELQTWRTIRINVVFLLMTLWLLSKASSATSTTCLAIGCVVLAGAHLKIFRQHPSLLPTVVPLCMLSYLFLQFVLGIDLVAVVAESAGRRPDLTGRTHIWDTVLSVDINPLFGVGYESFWLGSRLVWVWERAGTINHAHNGYLELYLNLGLLGLGLLIAFLVASYVTIRRRFKSSQSLGPLSLAMWTVLLIYNVSEAAFRPQFIWISFLMTVLVVPSNVAASRGGGTLRPRFRLTQER